MDSNSPPSLKYLKLSWPAPYVAHIEINRPEKLNAFIEPMWREFPPLLTYLSQNPSCRTIIVSGAGDRAFTTGLDIAAAAASNLFNPQPIPQTDQPEPWETNTTTTSSSEKPSPIPMSISAGTPSLDSTNNNTAYPRPHPPPPPKPSFPPPTSSLSTSSTDPARTALSLRPSILSFQSCISSLATTPKPLIAALHGHCLGLGIDIACCADIRLCTPSTKFSVKEVDLGLAADVGTLTRLGKVVGVGFGSWGKEVCLSGRGWGAGEAERVGFVSRVVGTGGDGGMPSSSSSSSASASKTDPDKSSLLQTAIQLASLIAEKSPVAVQGTKHLMDYSREHATEDGLRYTATWNAGMLQTGDIQEAMRRGGMSGGKTGRFAKL